MAEETIGRAGGPAADGCARLPAAVRRPGHLCAGRLTERHDMDLSPVTGEPLIENRTFDEIAIGQTASTTHTLTREDIELFAIVSGDVNPAQLDPAYAETDLFHRIVAHGMWGGVVDGPLAFDNAVSPKAARDKRTASPVASQADILVVPDLEARNMLAKQLSFLAGADAAGVVVGASVPIIVTSRADWERTRVASCAVAVLMAQAKQAALTGVTAS